MKTDLSIKAAIYLRAAELVEQGHCKGKLWVDATGENPTLLETGLTGPMVAFCYRGAIMRARYETTGERPKFSGMDWAYQELIELIQWNNAPDTTAAMVAAKLREQAFS